VVVLELREEIMYQ